MGSNNIYNVNKASRVVDFSKLPYVGTCSPTDLDFVIEVGDMYKYMFGDFKEKGKILTKGQRTLIERHCNAFSNYGYDSLGFLAWHDSDVSIIPADVSLTIEVYYVKAFQIYGIWERVKRRERFLDTYIKFFGDNY